MMVKACEQCEDGTYRLFDIEEWLEPCQTCPETMVSTTPFGMPDCNGDFFGEHRPDEVGTLFAHRDGLWILQWHAHPRSLWILQQPSD